MLFMGEEHGEPAPFQFFTDHIDEEIAVATREGRRREFSAFADFSAEEVPDPQDEATFRDSTLTRREAPGLRDLYERLLRARRALPAGDADAVDFDAVVPWLRVRRGPFTLACNFGDATAAVPVDGGSEVVLATHDARLQDDGVQLPPRAGALLRSAA
jgi:maltooligosyltrehalose trehalohydrolase